MRVEALRSLRDELPHRPTFAELKGTRDDAETMLRWASRATGATRKTDTETIELATVARASCVQYVRAVNGPSWRRQQITPGEWTRAAAALDRALTAVAGGIDECIVDAEDTERVTRERWRLRDQLREDA